MEYVVVSFKFEVTLLSEFFNSESNNFIASVCGGVYFWWKSCDLNQYHVIDSSQINIYAMKGKYLLVKIKYFLNIK